MDRTTALQQFGRMLSNPCPHPDCRKGVVGELCDTPSVWIHYERMKLYYDQEDKK